LITGVANANMDRSSILAITGQTNSNLRHKESHQNMDVISMFKPITKWRWSIHDADVIAEIVRRAFKISIEEKAGAVHLELPENIAKDKSDIKPIKKPQRTLRSRPNKGLIKKAVKMILSAKIPVILIGNGCIRGNASSNIRKFAEKQAYFQ